MRLLDRETDSRGRSPVPAMRPRTRRWRRRRACRVVRLMRAFRLCDGRSRRRSGCPCPCRARAGRTARSARSISPTACLSMPRTTTGSARAPRRRPPRRVHRHRVRVAHGELERLAAHLRAVADAHDLEPPLEAVLDPVDHVRDQRPRQPVQVCGPRPARRRRSGRSPGSSRSAAADRARGRSGSTGSRPRRRSSPAASPTCRRAASSSRP